jgi:VWFA-related protein
MICLRETLAAICALTLFASVGWPQNSPGQAAPTPSPVAQDATAQPQGDQGEPQARIRARTELVVVPVTVKDAAGALVPDLRKEQFRIFEDDVEQQISLYSNEAFPISAVVLIDNDLPQKLAGQVEASLASIAGGFSPNDEAFVCRYDHLFHEGKGFTSDNDKLLNELKRTDLDSSSSAPAPGWPASTGSTVNGLPQAGGPIETGTTQPIQAKSTKAVDDAVYAAAQLLLDRGRERRKIIFLISDGVNGRNNTYKFSEVVKVLLSAGISVYGVGVGNAVFTRKFTGLSKYAKATGGDVYYAARREELGDRYARVMEEARHQYTLAYTPRGTDRSLEYHSIEVRVTRPGLDILTRNGYYTAGVK